MAAREQRQMTSSKHMASEQHTQMTQEQQKQYSSEQSHAESSAQMSSMSSKMSSASQMQMSSANQVESHQMESKAVKQMASSSQMQVESQSMEMASSTQAMEQTEVSGMITAEGNFYQMNSGSESSTQEEQHTMTQQTEESHSTARQGSVSIIKADINEPILNNPLMGTIGGQNGVDYDQSLIPSNESNNDSSLSTQHSATHISQSAEKSQSSVTNGVETKSYASSRQQMHEEQHMSKERTLSWEHQDNK